MEPAAAPAAAVPLPQLTDVDAGGCPMGDVATLASLYRVAPLDSLVLPRVLPAPRRQTASARATRLEVLAAVTRAGRAAPHRVVVSHPLSWLRGARRCRGPPRRT